MLRRTRWQKPNCPPWVGREVKEPKDDRGLSVDGVEAVNACQENRTASLEYLDMEVNERKDDGGLSVVGM